MAKKKRQIVWHKKRGKFIPPSLLKPKGADHNDPQKAGQVQESRRADFARKFKDAVKQAVKKRTEKSE
ncbi:MAG: hypothetical protein ACLFPX_05560 [Candidatus Omnitrophota bacterium]